MPIIVPYYFLSFIFLVIIQIFTSRRVQGSLFQLIFTLTRSHRIAVFVISTLFLPGTIIHELSHVFVAKALFVHTGDIDIFPSFSDHSSSIKMGSAEIGITDPARRSIIGIAPIVVGITLIVVLVWLFGSSFDFRQAGFVWWQALLLLYFTFVLGNTFVSSNKDLEGVGGVVVTLILVILIVLLILYLTNQLSGQSINQLYQFVYTEPTQKLFYQASLSMLLPLLINLSILGLFKIFQK